MRKVNKNIKSTPTSFNALKASERYFDKQKLMDLSLKQKLLNDPLNQNFNTNIEHNDDENDDDVHVPYVIDSEKSHIAITAAMTGVSTLTGNHSGNNSSGNGVKKSIRNSISSSLSFVKDNRDIGVVPAVLLLVADSLEDKEKALHGFQQLLDNYEHHVLVEGMCVCVKRERYYIYMI